MSTLMFWNKQNGNSNQNGSENGSTGKNGKKSWLHSPESLVNGHVAYLVKVSDLSDCFDFSQFFCFCQEFEEYSFVTFMERNDISNIISVLSGIMT